MTFEKAVADIVIIGGGPVGLWTAIELKKKNPETKVVLYEKREQYIRDHTLTVQTDSLAINKLQNGDYFQDKFYGALFEKGTNENLDLHSGSVPDQVTISIKDFEAILKEYAQGLGISFYRKNIDAPETVMNMHPECVHFIAADGAHSKMRSALVGEDHLAVDDLLHSVSVRYQVEGLTSYLMDPTFKETENIVAETIRSYEEGEMTEVELRLIVDQDTFDVLPDMTSKAPLNLQKLGQHWDSVLGDYQSRQRIESVVNDLKTHWDIRKNRCDEKRIDGSEKITKIKLSRYASSLFAKTVSDKNNNPVGWYLVGDAAMGMPFYRSVNSGLQLSSRLASIIQSQNLSNRQKVQAYNFVRALKVQKEFTMVSAKLAGLKTYKNYVRPALRGATTGLKIAGFVAIAVPVVAVAAPVIGISYLIGKPIRLM